MLTGVGAVDQHGEGRSPALRSPSSASAAWGSSAVLGAKLAGARQIVAIDLSDEKLAFARALGATDAVNAGTPDAVAGDPEPDPAAASRSPSTWPGAVPALELAYAVDGARRA